MLTITSRLSRSAIVNAAPLAVWPGLKLIAVTVPSNGAVICACASLSFACSTAISAESTLFCPMVRVLASGPASSVSRLFLAWVSVASADASCAAVTEFFTLSRFACADFSEAVAEASFCAASVFDVATSASYAALAVS